jgi:hypothetical protein
LIILYFFIGWPVSIFVVYLFSIYLGRHPDHESVEKSPEARPPGGSV